MSTKREITNTSLDVVSNIRQYERASFGFDRLDGVELRWNQSARISKGLVFRKANVFHLNQFRLAGQINRTLSNSGFFPPFDAASDAKERTPTWASCTEYIGLSLPLIASRANLVKVSRNLCRLSGIMSAMRIELTRHAHLVLVTVSGWRRKALFAHMPLRWFVV